MTASTPGSRGQADRCPGALTVHPAADGGLARVRLPGGFVSAAQLGVLAAAASELGDGRLELTSRGNVQLRALPDGAHLELGERLADAGLLPSDSHERVRNIVASPLAGIDTGRGLGDIVTGVDRALCAQPSLAELPGRFLIAVDDGRGDVARLRADVTAVMAGDRVRVGELGAPRRDAATLIAAICQAFLDERTAQSSNAWRVAELDDGPSRVLRRAARGLAGAVSWTTDDVPRLPDPPAEPVGVIRQHDGAAALAVLAPLGRLGAGQLRLLAELAGRRGVRITPWRSVVIPDLADAVHVVAAIDSADRAGLGTSAASPWYRVSACAGQPGCAKALSDVQKDARQSMRRWPGRQVHWSGCERRCGRPVDTEVDLIATGAGYDVSVSG